MKSTIKDRVHSEMKPVIKKANRRKYKVIYTDEIPFFLHFNLSKLPNI